MKGHKLFLVLSLLWILSCGNDRYLQLKSPKGNGDSILSESMIQKNPYHVVSHHEHEGNHFRIDSISCESVCIIITTQYLKESVANGEMRLFKPAVVNQSINFYSNGKMIRELPSPAIKVYQKLESGYQREMLDNVIFLIGIFEINSEAFIFINGYGGCNGDCSGMVAIINSTGRFEFLDYSIGNKIITRSGSLESFLKQQGIEHLPDMYEFFVWDPEF